jgi:hypothetical protein
MEGFFMKNLFSKVRNFGTTAVCRVYTAVFRTNSALSRSRSVLMDNKAEGFVDTAVKILMAVVIGALVLAGLYLLFSGTILPELTKRITDMFNYKG